MSDPASHWEGYGFLGAVAAGLVYVATHVWIKLRPGEPMPLPTGAVLVTPADVRASVLAVDQRIAELMAEIHRFMDEEKSVHPRILELLKETREEQGRLRESLARLAILEEQRRP